MNEIEKLKSEIKVLQAKVEFLEELKVYKTPAQEAYKEYCGEHPPTNPSVDNIDDLSWEYFQAGWNAAQPKDAEVQTLIPPPLYAIIKEWNDDDNQPTCEELADKISVWLNDNRWNFDGEYYSGWNDCIDDLRQKIK